MEQERADLRIFSEKRASQSTKGGIGSMIVDMGRKSGLK